MDNNNAPTEKRRTKRDRREITASPFTYHRLLGRRRADRREEEPSSAAQVIDVYPKHLIIVTTCILLLCALDAHNTLLLLQQGAVELNPLMDVVLKQSSSMFVVCKFALTSFAVILLVPHHHERFFFNRFKGRHALYFSLSIYLLLISYQWSIFPGGISSTYLF
ncbi:MAG: DUF5658 family protein [Candidatus Polarisedimenticolaceae bacterium]|nr:DUF5658 family protein [Candidatus Polarisedimenticolaceae bacterium]